MQKSRVRVRKRGQITLPQEIRNRWRIQEGSEIDIISDEDQAIIKPIKRTRIQEDAGALGPADKDEIEFAIIDPELISQHYSKKYRR
jgi:AbrB family looped-hinge helix DNA binding protein